jgi:AraC-like DNA-binding protein
MDGLRVEHIGRYDRPQRLVGRQRFHGISLYVGGARSWRLAGLEMPVDRPALYLAVRGTPYVVAYGPERENWVAEVSGLAFAGCDGLEVEAQVPLSPLPLRLHRHRVLARGELLEIRSVFRAVQARALRPAADRAFRDDLDLRSLLARLLRSDDQDVPQAVRELKRRLDDDTGIAQTLADLLAGCGSSPDHLRRGFRQAYGSTPAAYRARRRWTLARQWLAVEGLAVKEVAWRLGYAHASAFSAAFTAATGRTPGAVRRLGH